MIDYAQKWAPAPRRRQATIPTTVRLRPSIDCRIQNILAEFPHLTFAQVCNDLLEDALSRAEISLGQ